MTCVSPHICSSDWHAAQLRIEGPLQHQLHKCNAVSKLLQHALSSLQRPALVTNSRVRSDIFCTITWQPGQRRSWLTSTSLGAGVLRLRAEGSAPRALPRRLGAGLPLCPVASPPYGLAGRQARSAGRRVPGFCSVVAVLRVLELWNLEGFKRKE